jgi:hypothetical protein
MGSTCRMIVPVRSPHVASMFGLRPFAAMHEASKYIFSQSSTLSRMACRKRQRGLAAPSC